MTYKEWMRAADLVVSGATGMSIHDLPDFPSWDMWDAGNKPVDGARDALERAGADQEIMELLDD